jgi:predicted RNA-binding protein with PIN domain
MPDKIPQGSARSRIRVVFSEGKETADQVIVRLVKADKAPSNLLVVSSDRRDIVHTVRYRGAQTMGSGEFAQSLEDALREPAAAEKPEAMSKAEVEEWLELFGQESE